jgi:hypothetical protein
MKINYMPSPTYVNTNKLVKKARKQKTLKEPRSEGQARDLLTKLRKGEITIERYVECVHQLLKECRMEGGKNANRKLQAFYRTMSNTATCACCGFKTEKSQAQIRCMDAPLDTYGLGQTYTVQARCSFCRTKQSLRFKRAA